MLYFDAKLPKSPQLSQNFRNFVGMIPKVIHYCWFGRNPLPKSALKCIESWRKFCPDYEIKEWNEDNFDVNSTPFTEQAYCRRKYAFVSDYARFLILHTHGGLYFDTDVELIKPIDDIVAKGAFMGIEKAALGVNPGLGLAAENGEPIYKEIIDYYASLSFVDSAGNQIPGTVVKHTTDVLKRHGFKEEDRFQSIAGINIYPNEYFNPLDDATGRLEITPNTRSIHWYSKTWVDNYGPTRTWITRRIHRYFGVNSISWLKKMINR